MSSFEQDKEKVLDRLDNFLISRCCMKSVDSSDETKQKLFERMICFLANEADGGIIRAFLDDVADREGIDVYGYVIDEDHEDY